MGNVYHNEWSPQLTSLLVETTQHRGRLGFAPGHELTGSSQQACRLQVFFLNSGTEASEGALKIAGKISKDWWSLKHNKPWEAQGSVRGYLG